MAIYARISVIHAIICAIEAKKRLLRAYPEIMTRFLSFANLIILILSGLAIFSIKNIERQACIQAENDLLKEHLHQVELDTDVQIQGRHFAYPAFGR